jgi:GPH family glycoside/pentoside/hexuronide:cation symporter/probable glucitol transport protein GutA
MDLNKPVKNGCVPRKELLYFATGLAGQNMAYGLFAGWMFYYCTDVIKLSSLYAGLIVGITRIWDGFNDPFMGVLIDRHRFKNNEKLRPFLINTPILIGIMIILTFMIPDFKNEILTVFYILFIYFIWDVLYTAEDIAIWGMTSVMSPLSFERITISKWAKIGGMIGSWAPGIIPLVIGSKDMLNISEKNLFIIFAIVFGFGGMAVSMFSYKAQERITSPNEKEHFFKSFGLIFKNKIVMILFLSSILNSFSLCVPAVYFFKYKVSMTIFGHYINGLNVMFIYGTLVGMPGTLAMFIAPWIGRKVHGLKNILIIAQLSSIIMRMIAYFVGFEGNKIMLNMLLLAIAGIPGGITGIAFTALWGDSLDYMEWKTGKRAEAFTFSMQNLISKATAGISSIISGVLLTVIKFDSNKYDAGLPQDALFDKWIWPIYILGPVVGAILYLIPLLFFRYPESMKQQVEEELIIRRNQKIA